MVKAGVLMRRGILAPEAATKRTPIDKGIMALALRCLSHTEWLVFYFAYGCTESFEEMKEKFKNDIGKEVEQETLERYARQARRTILEKAANAPELDGYDN
jgi:hypothetical protein